MSGSTYTAVPSNCCQFPRVAGIEGWVWVREKEVVTLKYGLLAKKSGEFSKGKQRIG